MKRIVLAALFLFFAYSVSFAQSKAEKQVASAVAELLKAMEDGNTAVLDKISVEKLTYGHSGGNIEKKKQFLNTFATGASDYVKINVSDQTIDVTKKTAIVRHLIDAETNDNNKPGHLRLKVMTVWQKMGGKWKLIARQAVKPPAA